MSYILDNIIQCKFEEVVALHEYIKQYPSSQLNQLLQGQKKRTRTQSLQKQLSKNHLSIIAEIKRRSPSKAHLAQIDDVTKIAEQYLSAPADAISVLTDEKFFAGHLSDLTKVSALTENTSCAVLRKDFTIDAIQIVQAIAYGADAILLIVAATQEKTKDLLQMTTELNIEAIVEVHTLKELEFALTLEPKIIGINNRNLKNFTVDIQHSLDLIKYIPQHILKISESGIHNAEQAQLLYCAGFDAILVGEALVRSTNPAELIQRLRGKS